MKLLLATLGLLGGVVLPLGTFAGGVAVAMWLPEGEPRQLGSGPEVAELWTSVPRTVNRAEQKLERLPATTVATLYDGPGEGALLAKAQLPDIDPILTSSATDRDATEQATLSAEPAVLTEVIPPIHVEWCSDRYRSYRPEENAYTAYSGEVRTCISPYWDESQSTAFEEEPEPAGQQVASNDPYYLPEESEASTAYSSAHVRNCFQRYRSYRVEDNSYQPFGGGPRRQCR